MLPPLAGTARPPTATQLSGGWSFITHMILSALCTACSTRLSPHSQVKLYQLRICHSMSLMPAGRWLSGGIGFTGFV